MVPGHDHCSDGIGLLRCPVDLSHYLQPLTQMTHHPQVQASRNIMVDEGMAALLELLWERGYETEFSCQGGEEWTRNIGGETKIYHTTEAYLVFTDFEDGVRLLHEVYDANPDTGEFVLQLKLSKVGPGLGDIPRAHLTWYHKHTEAILQGLMAMVMAS